MSLAMGTKRRDAWWKVYKFDVEIFTNMCLCMDVGIFGNDDLLLDILPAPGILKDCLQLKKIKQK